MIAACPRCKTRYRIEREKLGAEGVRLRCTRCEALFRVRAPEAQEESAPGAAAVGSASQAANGAAAAALPPDPTAAGVQEAPAPPGDAAAPSAPSADAAAPAQVGLAIPDAEVAKQTAGALRELGLSCFTVHDGVEAMLEIQRQMPRVVVLASDLPKMYGFQVCEVVKRNQSLSSIHVVLVGAIHLKERYRRPPDELYGADAYVEQPDLPEALLPILARFGLGEAPRADGSPALPAPGPEPGAAVPRPEAMAPPEPVVPAPGPEASPLAAPASAPDPGLLAAPASAPDPGLLAAPASAPDPGLLAAPASAPDPGPLAAPAGATVAQAAAGPAVAGAVDDGLESERDKAERLARIIVSDIVLYNEARFNEALRVGNVVEALSAEVAEGRALFAERVDERVRSERDHLTDELIRVAQSRGMG